MKFNPTWQQVALLFVLLAAVIASHLLAPLAVSAITSLVSTIIGALFVNLQPSKAAPPESAEARPATFYLSIAAGAFALPRLIRA